MLVGPVQGGVRRNDSDVLLGEKPLSNALRIGIPSGSLNGEWMIPIGAYSIFILSREHYETVKSALDS